VVDLDVHNRGAMVREGPSRVREGGGENRAYSAFFLVEYMVDMAASTLASGEGALPLLV
jgi:hypothetical protein